MAFSKHCRFVFKFVTSGHFSKQSQTVCYDGWAGVRKAVTPHLLSLSRFLPPFKNALHRSQVCVNIRLPLLELKWFGYECICTRISIDTHTYIHIYIYTYIQICIYKYVYIYVYMYTHIYTHAWLRNQASKAAACFGNAASRFFVKVGSRTPTGRFSSSRFPTVGATVTNPTL